MIPHTPVVPVDAQMLDERHWRRVSVGERIRGHWQAYMLMPPAPGWHLSVFWTSDNQYVSGRTAYRAPASFSAWCEVIPQYIAKVVRRWRGKE